jgi:hypothetical protein
MIDPVVSYFLLKAAEVGTWAASGIVGNSAHAAVRRAIPKFQQWYQGEGQPANHDLQ